MRLKCKQFEIGDRVRGARGGNDFSGDRATGRVRAGDAGKRGGSDERTRCAEIIAVEEQVNPKPSFGPLFFFKQGAGCDLM